LRRFRALLGDLAGLAGDETLDAAALRSRLSGLIAPFEPERQTTQVTAIRQELGRKSQDLARLLKMARSAALTVPADHRLTAAFATLDAVAASSVAALPDADSQPFGSSWQSLIEQPDRAAALGCFRAATLMALKRALRNRSVSVAHSLSHRAPEDKLIPLKLWQRNHGRFIRDLNLPASAEKYLPRLEAGLTAGLRHWPRPSKPARSRSTAMNSGCPAASRLRRILASNRPARRSRAPSATLSFRTF
jgi:hypothetical protein